MRSFKKKPRFRSSSICSIDRPSNIFPICLMSGPSTASFSAFLFSGGKLRYDNGSVNLLAEAMKRVISESVEGAIDPVKKDAETLKGKMDDMQTAMDSGFDDIRARLNPEPKEASTTLRLDTDRLDGGTAERSPQD